MFTSFEMCSRQFLKKYMQCKNCFYNTKKCFIPLKIYVAKKSTVQKYVHDIFKNDDTMAKYVPVGQ